MTNQSQDQKHCKIGLAIDTVNDSAQVSPAKVFCEHLQTKSYIATALIGTRQTKTDLHTSLQNISTCASKCASSEIVVSYYGHGVNNVSLRNDCEEDGQDTYWRLNSNDKEDFSDDELDDWLASLPDSARVYLIIESCFSGGIPFGKGVENSLRDFATRMRRGFLSLTQPKTNRLVVNAQVLALAATTRDELISKNGGWMHRSVVKLTGTNSTPITWAGLVLAIRKQPDKPIDILAVPRALGRDGCLLWAESALT